MMYLKNYVMVHKYSSINCSRVCFSDCSGGGGGGGRGRRKGGGAGFRRRTMGWGKKERKEGV